MRIGDAEGVLPAVQLIVQMIARCITVQGLRLTKADKQCAERCGNRYLDAWNVVSHVLSQLNDQIARRAQNEK